MAGPRRQDDVVIRPRVPADDAPVARLNNEAFGTPDEARLIQALRDAGLAAVELVAVERPRVEGPSLVGHILFSALDVTVDGRPVKALALAPMAVAPARHRQGIVGMLIRTGLDRARADEWDAVIVLGHPRYYPRFGFSAAAARHLQAPYSGDAFMALALRPGALDGPTAAVSPIPRRSRPSAKPPRAAPSSP